MPHSLYARTYHFVFVVISMWTSNGEHQSTDIRLSDGLYPNQGRLEIFVDGVWGTVCRDRWDVMDATVACRQLRMESIIGYQGNYIFLPACTFVLMPEVNNYYPLFGPGSGPIFLEDVECVGCEQNIVQCNHSGLRASDCSHDDDVGVVCHSDLYPNYDIRLVDDAGGAPNRGRVEYFSNPQWTVICNALDSYAADVACQQLGFPSAVASFLGHPGEDYYGIKRIVHTVDLCQENQASRIQDCASSWYFQTACSAYSWLDCEKAVRLIDGKYPNSGRLEVYLNGKFGTVCTNRWNITEANVVCHQLGFHAAIQTLKFKQQLHRPVNMYDVHCRGGERSIMACRHTYALKHACDTYEDAGVVCRSDEFPEKFVPLPGPNVIRIIIGSVFGALLLLLYLVIVCKKTIDKQRYNRMRHRRMISGSSPRSFDSSTANGLLPSVPNIAEIPPQNNVPEPEDRSQDELREFPTLSLDVIPPSFVSNGIETPPAIVAVPDENGSQEGLSLLPTYPVPSSPDLSTQHDMEIRNPESEDQVPAPSAPPEYDVFMEVDRGDFVPQDSNGEFRTQHDTTRSDVILPNTPPSTVDLPPISIPSAPPEYDVFMEVDRNDFVLEESTPESDTEPVSVAPFTSNVTLHATVALLPSAPPSRDSPPGYEEFIANQNRYGFVSEAESHATPPPEYQSPDASALDDTILETTTEV